MKRRLSNKAKAALAEQTIAHALRGIQEAIDPDNILPAAEQESLLAENYVLSQCRGGPICHLFPSAFLRAHRVWEIPLAVFLLLCYNTYGD